MACFYPKTQAEVPFLTELQFCSKVLVNCDYSPPLSTIAPTKGSVFDITSINNVFGVKALKSISDQKLRSDSEAFIERHCYWTSEIKFVEVS